MLIFTGYFDESGTHDTSPVTIVSGLLGHSKQWEEFDRAFDALKRKHDFKVWHTKKLKQKRGEFQRQRQRNR